MKTRALPGGTAPEAVRGLLGRRGGPVEKGDNGVNKTYRQGQILRLIKNRKIHTQEQLAQELAAQGITATQVTLSRDIRELGLVKTPEGYRQVEATTGPGIEYMAGEFLWHAVSAQNILILKTAPGHASSVAVSLDQEEWPEVVGTIAGDDTVLVVTPDTTSASDSAGAPAVVSQGIAFSQRRKPLGLSADELSRSFSSSSSARMRRNSGVNRACSMLRNESALILLLRLVVTAIKSMDGPAVAIGAVRGSAVPAVGIHDHDRSGGPSHESLLGVLIFRSSSSDCGNLFHWCDPGMIRNAPFSGVKSSIIQTVLQTQYPFSSAMAPMSA